LFTAEAGIVGKFPCWIAGDVVLDTDGCLSGAVGEAAFDIINLFDGVAKELFLSGAMRTPESAVEFDVFFGETVGEVVVVREWFEVEVEERDECEDEQNDEPGFGEFEEILGGYLYGLFSIH